jgi:flagellar protein FlaG
MVPAVAGGSGKLPPELAQAASPTSAAQVDASKTAPKASAATLSEAELAKQVHAMQDKMDKLNPALAFVVDKDTGKALIQLTDRVTKEVILQFPTEAALQITKALDRFQKGQLVNRTV